MCKTSTTFGVDTRTLKTYGKRRGRDRKKLMKESEIYGTGAKTTYQCTGFILSALSAEKEKSAMSRLWIVTEFVIC